MKANELRTKSDTELGEELMSLRKAAFNLRVQQATGQLNRPSEVKQVRRDIARVKTIISERSGGSEA
jgi:large subunit ribosomal protein L29